MRIEIYSNIKGTLFLYFRQKNQSKYSSESEKVKCFAFISFSGSGVLKFRILLFLRIWRAASERSIAEKFMQTLFTFAPGRQGRDPEVAPCLLYDQITCGMGASERYTTHFPTH